MGIISIEQVDRLYWLGRYSERVYTTLKLFARRYDIMIDQDLGSYEEFCRNLDIPNIYRSPEDFKERYAFSPEDVNSIYSNLLRAYDNAIELREMIGSDALSYIQLAIYAMNRAQVSDAPLIELQKVMDNILAFWGITDDCMYSEYARNTIKAGKRIERIDLYGRLKLSPVEMQREVHRLAGRIGRSALDYDQDVMERLSGLVTEENLRYDVIVKEVERILEKQ